MPVFINEVVVRTAPPPASVASEQQPSAVMTRMERRALTDEIVRMVMIRLEREMARLTER